MKALKTKIDLIIKTICVLIFLLMIVFLQGIHDDLSPPFTYKLEAVRKTLLPANVLQYMSFGFNAVTADLYWVLAVQDYVQWNASDLFYLDYFKNIRTLDPKFEYPYLFSILAVPIKGDTKVLDIVAENAAFGIEAIPASWKIPYYLGTQYYLFTKTFEKAEQYLKIAVEKKDAPPGAYLVYSSFVTRGIKGYKTAKELISVIYNNTNDETIKKIASLGLQESIVSQMLEKGILAYKAKYTRYPSSITELTDNRFISLPEAFFDLFTVTIDQRNGSFKIEARK